MPKKKAARKSAGPKPADGQSAKRKAGASAAASANSQKGRPGQTSKHRGVSWDRSKWVVKIRRNGVLKKLGRFAEEEEAAAAYQAAAKVPAAVATALAVPAADEAEQSPAPAAPPPPPRTQPIYKPAKDDFPPPILVGGVSAAAERKRYYESLPVPYFRGPAPECVASTSMRGFKIKLVETVWQPSSPSSLRLPAVTVCCRLTLSV